MVENGQKVIGSMIVLVPKITDIIIFVIIVVTVTTIMFLVILAIAMNRQSTKKVTFASVKKSS